MAAEQDSAGDASGASYAAATVADNEKGENQMRYHEREKANAHARFARSIPTDTEQPTGGDVHPFTFPRSASSFLLGIVLSTLFWWFSAYQTQVPCPEPKLLLPPSSTPTAAQRGDA